MPVIPAAEEQAGQNFKVICSYRAEFEAIPGSRRPYTKPNIFFFKKVNSIRY